MQQVSQQESMITFQTIEHWPKHINTVWDVIEKGENVSFRNTKEIWRDEDGTEHTYKVTKKVSEADSFLHKRSWRLYGNALRALKNKSGRSLTPPERVALARKLK